MLILLIIIFKTMSKEKKPNQGRQFPGEEDKRPKPVGDNQGDIDKLRKGAEIPPRPIVIKPKNNNTGG